MEDKLIRFKKLIQETLESEEYIDTFALGIFLCADSNGELGFCMTPGNGINLDMIKNKFKEFIDRNLQNKQSRGYAVTMALYTGLLEAMVKNGYIQIHKIPNPPNSQMAN